MVKIIYQISLLLVLQVILAYAQVRDRIFKGTTWRNSGQRIVSTRNRWVFEFRRGDIVTYPVGQPNNASWTSRAKTQGKGRSFVYAANGDLSVRDSANKILWGLRTSSIPHNHTGIADNGILALWNNRSQFVRQINTAANRNFVGMEMEDMETKDEATCGVAAVRPDESDEAKPVKNKSWPWVVYLEISHGLNATTFCVGTLINQNWILTTASCFFVSELKETRAYLGVLRRSERRKAKEFRIPAKNIIKHPRFDNHMQRNDIALLKLPTSVEFNENISPICLPKKDYAKTSLKTLIAGWKQEPIRTGDIMMQDQISIKPLQICKNVFPKKNRGQFFENEQICAGKHENETSSSEPLCLISGSPQIIANPDNNNQFIQIGFLTHGPSFSCNVKDIYTNVAGYTDWIEKTIAQGQMSSRDTSIAVKDGDFDGMGSEDVETKDDWFTKNWNEKKIALRLQLAVDGLTESVKNRVIAKFKSTKELTKVWVSNKFILKDKFDELVPKLIGGTRSLTLNFY